MFKRQVTWKTGDQAYQWNAGNQPGKEGSAFK